MIVFTLKTMRIFLPLDLAPWPNILAYLQRIGKRPALLAGSQIDRIVSGFIYLTFP